MIGVGVRIGDWTPYLSWSRYQEESSNDEYEPEIFITTSLTLRYDINTSNAVKAQIEKFDDRSLFDFVGDTTVFTMSYDFVF